ncbi:polymer-forming cytoskeletal protein [Curvibacter sp. CHRR-16]|uniref:bactofilin family protein n=1 Tax=Curvibacter sp. CHRR-16 TaxID=2835872 RepID=UPI001BDB1F87|nr:polymer-forming cytoskeletal protein [Curvibacter sp. CHRR-16]MBT0569891.1 polymer-forming cytoskeletal protein [Curvibacter sp. CHRR-16]
MFNKNKQPAIRSLIAETTEINGNIQFADGMRVDGVIHGDVKAQDGVPSMLLISETARITGMVVADHIILNGAVKGPVHARQMLELQSKARIEGDVEYTALEMHQGALISGQLRPLLDIEEKPTLKLAANNQ